MLIHDAWTFRALLTGRGPDGNIAKVSEPFRPFAETLANLSLIDRPPAWQSFLATRTDAPAIISALAEVNPDGPAPEVGEDERADGWEEIKLGSLPRVEPFPLDVLPAQARAIAEAASLSISCPVDFAAAGTLATASALIGRSAMLRVKPGYHQSAALFLAVVGGPSSGKSPALKIALAPVWDVANLFRAAGSRS